jgi:hypothetical protein
MKNSYSENKPYWLEGFIRIFNIIIVGIILIWIIFLFVEFLGNPTFFLARVLFASFLIFIILKSRLISEKIIYLLYFCISWVLEGFLKK